MDPEAIAPDRWYPLKAFKAASGLNDGALRVARQKGLRILYLHNRAFVWGQDFCDYLVTHGRPEKNHRAPQ